MRSNSYSISVCVSNSALDDPPYTTSGFINKSHNVYTLRLNPLFLKSAIRSNIKYKKDKTFFLYKNLNL